MIPNDFVLSFDYIEDAAANIKRGMDEGEPGEEYIIASEPRNFVEVFDIAERLTGIPAPRAVSGSVFQLLSYGVAGLEYVTRPPEGLESEFLDFFATGGVLVDNSKADRELGIDHRPLDESLQEYFEWEVEQQGLESKISGELA